MLILHPCHGLFGLIIHHLSNTFKSAQVGLGMGGPAWKWMQLATTRSSPALNLSDMKAVSAVKSRNYCLYRALRVEIYG